MKKQITVMLMSTLLLGPVVNVVTGVQTISADTVVTEQETVSIPDANLRKELQSALGKDVPLTIANLQKIESLNLTYSDVTDLTGLSYLKNLKLLDLTGNAISDISELGRLPVLASVSLRFNKAKSLPDLAPLKTTAINQLNLVGDDYGPVPEKLSAISDLTQLVNLELQNTKITKIPDLSKLASLTTLGVAGNKITDVSALAGMTSLTDLSINANQITDFTPVASLVNLETLHIGNNRSADVHALKSLTKLKRANFSQMGLSDNEMQIFKHMKSLESLAIDFNDQISDLSALSELTNLTDLDFSKDNVQSLAPLLGLKNLKNLGFSNNNVSDVSVLKNLTNIQTINMMRNHIYDISSLKDLNNLQRVNAKFQTINLPERAMNAQGDLGFLPLVVKSRKDNVLPLALQSTGQLKITEDGMHITGVDTKTDQATYLAWETDAQDAPIKFTGTVTQPFSIKTDKPETNQAVKISVLKGDGSNLTSVASNFIQSDALVETQPNGKKTLLIKVIVPKNYGADSITFMNGQKASSTVVGETIVLTYRFALDKDALTGKPFKENMHVKINPEVMNYDHKYDVFFKIKGLSISDGDASHDAEGNNKEPEGDKPVKEPTQPDADKKPQAPHTDLPGQVTNNVLYKAHYLKQGTTDISVMAQYMADNAQLYYRDGAQYVVISGSDAKSAAMIERMSLNGKNFFKRENNKFYFNLGSKKLQDQKAITFDGYVGVSTFIPGLGQFEEYQPFTLKLDERKVQKNQSNQQPTGESKSVIEEVVSPENPVSQGTNHVQISPLSKLQNDALPVVVPLETNAVQTPPLTNTATTRSETNAAENQVAKSKDNDKDRKQKEAATNVNQNNVTPDQDTAIDDQTDMNQMFLIVGGIIATLLGFVAVTLGWLIFKG